MIFFVDSWNTSYLAYQSKVTLFGLLSSSSVKVRGSSPSLITYVSQNRVNPCKYWVLVEESKRQLFALKGGRFWLVAGSLWWFVGSS